MALLFLESSILLSQGIGGRRSSSFEPQDTFSREQFVDSLIIDTIYSYRLFDKTVRKKVNKDLENILIFPYDPVKTLTSEDAHLGNPGSPYYNLFYESDGRIGLRLGGHPYSKYDMDNDDFLFYELKSGFSDMYYSQTGQPNSLFRGLFSRNFAKGKSQFVLRYHRINQEGYYQRQDAKNTAISTGLTLKFLNNRLNTAILFSSNLYTQNNNGGITSTAVLTGDFEDERMNVPVNLSSSLGKDHKLQYTLFNSFDLIDNQKNKSSFRLFHKLQFDVHNLLKIDNSPEVTYHGNYFITSDSLDYRLDIRSLRNQFGLDLRFNPTNPIQLTSILEYNRHNIFASHFDRDLDDILLRNNISFTYKDRYQVAGRLELGLSQNSGELLLSGNIKGPLNKYINFESEVQLMTQQPQFIESNIVLNDSLYFTNTLNNQKTFSWKNTLSFEKMGIDLSYNSILINDFIYWDSERAVTQSTGSISVQQIGLNSRLHWKFIHLSSNVKFQFVSDDLILRMPKIIVNETLYAQGAVFKKRLNFKTGINLRLLGTYEYMTYYPLLGIFHHDTETRGASYYPDANLFMEIKVDAFKFYFLFENVYQYIIDDLQFELANYPQFDQRLRVGLRWIFRN